MAFVGVFLETRVAEQVVWANFIVTPKKVTGECLIAHCSEGVNAPKLQPSQIQGDRS